MYFEILICVNLVKEDKRTWFFGRHENKRTCFLGGDKRTEEHVFLKDKRT